MKDEHHERRRFWSRVRHAHNGCWLWTGGTRKSGYGSFAVKNAKGKWTQTTANRWSYADQVGPIPAGYEVDHLCRNRGCVRPDHLEAVTVAENRRRRDIKYAPPVDRSFRPLPVIPPPPKAVTKPKRNPKTHCINGHAYAEVGWRKNGRFRTCVGCDTDRNHRRRKGGQHGTETHCPQGHAYSGNNLYVRARGGRECRTCTLDRNRRARAKKKQRERS